MKCPNCHTELPEDARFCHHCGAPQPRTSRIEEAQPCLIDLSARVYQQLTELFFRRLRAQIDEEQPGADAKAFSEHLYESGFRDRLHRRQEQLSEELQRMAERGAAAAEVNRKIDTELDELIDYFIIHYCRELQTVPLPEAILRYQGLSQYEIDLPRMVFDYLAFDQEPDEQVYTDFVKMPVEKLRNAGKFFLFPEQRDERIFFICDQSLLGSCKEGFAMTNRGLYWKAQLQTARKALYEAPLQLAREKDWLLINGEFFNANPRLNIRMMKLLRKISRFQSR